MVGDEVLEPGWQSYGHRIAYRVSDVGSLLTLGRNLIEAEVAAGWYAGRLGFFEQREIYGSDLAVLAQLDAQMDGQWAPLVWTDSSWTWRSGPTLDAELYDGETYDARRADLPAGEPGLPVDLIPVSTEKLEQRLGPPVRRTETVPPVQIFRSATGRVLVDFGRNLVGWVRIRVSGAAGQEIVLRHAEVLEGGELGTRPLRTAQATDRYILSGVGEET
ncbi:MAG: family 78 glycoside hydrolase catalytic domain, partial [Propionicimonas sp.]|nr:family 78 glycoside hydrolase catalytic domain [Propionicimonas sp.]